MSLRAAYRALGLSCLATALFVAGGCGSRTPLRSDSNACYEPDAVEACSDDCGPGTRTCTDGIWQPCQVPVAQRPCSNDCGPGVATCTDGSWTTCVVPVATRDCSTLCGTGHETCKDGQWQDCDAPQPKAPRLRATVRDFHDTHPDFERSGYLGDDRGIVEDVLGPDDKPVYAGNPTTPTTSGKYYFDTWYRDTPGINETTTIFIPLTPSPNAPGTLVYDNNAFFPIDGQLFGNEGRNHNFHFTMEIAVLFHYAGGETFRFTGDDDLWVFINRRLAINLGGLHSAESASVDLDAKSQDLGIGKGQNYPLNLFFAERHTTASTFHVETTVAEWDACD
jgi:fibro-slime domain-containing protein